MFRKSKLRSSNVEVDGVRYKGAKTSRKDLYDEGDVDMGSASGSDEVSGSESDEEKFASGSEDDEESDDEETSENEDITTITDEKRSKLKALLDNEQKTMSSHLTSIAQTDAQKGESIQNQMIIYEAILDARIKLQKGLAAANTMPLSEEQAEPFTGEKTPKRTKAVKGLLYDMLDQLTTLRVNMLKNEGLDTDGINVNKKRTLEAAMSNANQLETVLTPYRDAVLTKWSRKIQAASGASALNQSKFSIQNQNAKLQVTTNLADMERLVKRTRVNRSNYVILGEDEKVESNKKNVDSNLQEREEIFDDTDFYRILLKDLVDRRMADSGAATGMKWTVVKPKIKKNVDTKASKGRKLRYHVQEKIQNFDAPRQFIKWNDDQIEYVFLLFFDVILLLLTFISELFAGLFGQKVEVNEGDEESEKEGEEVVVNDGLKIFG